MTSGEIVYLLCCFLLKLYMITKTVFCQVQTITKALLLSESIDEDMSVGSVCGFRPIVKSVKICWLCIVNIYKQHTHTPHYSTANNILLYHTLNGNSYIYYIKCSKMFLYAHFHV